MERLTVQMRGRVQGVGFRYATMAQAEALGLAGWVRNCPDGAVEAAFYGPRRILEQMLAWCEHGPRAARVDSVDAAWESVDESPQSFRIR